MFDASFWEALQLVISTVLYMLVVVAFTMGGMYIRQWIRSMLGQQNLNLLLMIARTAVNAVEQMANDEWSPMVKKDAAITYAQMLLDRYGIQLDVDEIAIVIETAVFEELNKWQPFIDGQTVQIEPATE